MLYLANERVNRHRTVNAPGIKHNRLHKCYLTNSTAEMMPIEIIADFAETLNI